MKEHVFRYEGEGPGRLDKLLAAELSSSKLEAITRSQLKLLIESGSVTVGGVVATKAGAIVKPGMEVVLRLPEPEPTTLVPYELEVNVLFEDKDIIVIDKPTGLSMHPGAGNKRKTLVNALVHHFGRNPPETFSSGTRPGIVHRLDRDTTGVVVVAKSAAAHANLAEQFAKRTVGREYQALVYATPRALREINSKDSGKIAANIARDPRERKRMAVTAAGGKKAVTHWRVLERMTNACLLAVRLETGRTHQIRVHMTHIGSPVIGDKTYGNLSDLPAALRLASERLGRQALHAYKLEIAHPRSGKRMQFESPLPDDFQAVLAEFRKEGTR